MDQFNLLGNAPVCREKDMSDLTLPPHAECFYTSEWCWEPLEKRHICLLSSVISFLPSSHLTNEFLEVLSFSRDSVGLSSVLLSYYWAWKRVFNRLYPSNSIPGSSLSDSWVWILQVILSSYSWAFLLCTGKNPKGRVVIDCCPPSDFLLQTKRAVSEPFSKGNIRGGLSGTNCRCGRQGEDEHPTFVWRKEVGSH